MNDQFISSDDFEDEDYLEQTTVATGNLLVRLVDYIESEFKTTRTRATFAAGILVSSLPTMIEKNTGGRKEVQGIINDFEEIVKSEANKN